MKKIVFLAASAAMLVLTACNSCGRKNQQGLIIESETDSLYMVNDSTVGDLQTFVFEGLIPTDDGYVSNTILTVQTVDLNEDGSYTINTTYQDGSGNSMETNDSGETVVIIGIPNDSTAIIYELISYSDTPNMHFRMNKDSSFTKLNKNMQPLSKDPKHKLKIGSSK